MKPLYFRLADPIAFPKINDLGPLQVVLIATKETTSTWKSAVADWLIASNCLAFIVWGHDGSAWEHSVDLALLKKYDYDVPDASFCCTTCHSAEALGEALFFAKFTSSHPNVEIGQTILLHVSDRDSREELLAEYDNAQ